MLTEAEKRATIAAANEILKRHLEESFPTEEMQQYRENIRKLRGEPETEQVDPADEQRLQVALAAARAKRASSH